MDFIAFDCETANSKKESICALGYCVVKDNAITEKEYFLINPEDDFNFININIHGITEEMVIDAPTFPEVWAKISYKFESYPLVAHAAKCADKVMLEKTLKRYNIASDGFLFYDTLEIVKKNLKLKNNKLETICEHFNILLDDHHNALCDAVATAKIMIQLFNNNFIIFPLNKNKAKNYSSSNNDNKNYQIKNIPVSGFIAPQCYTEFISNNEILEYLKSKNIVAKTKEYLKPLFYNGLYSDYKICRCTVAGYVDNDTIVISVDNHLHCVNIEHFSEMQPLINESDNYLHNIPFYVKYLHGSPRENEVLNGIKSLLSTVLLTDSALRLQINKSEYNSIYIDLKPNAYRIGFDKSALFLRIYDDDSIGYVAFPSKTKSIFEKFNISFENNLYDEFAKIEINTFLSLLKSKNKQIEKVLNLIFLSSFEFSSFGCCSRFKECSDKKQCVHSDAIYSTACLYRKNLENGNIFY